MTTSTTREPLLVIDDLVAEYPAKGIGTKPCGALKGCSIDVYPGERVGLVLESSTGRRPVRVARKG